MATFKLPAQGFEIEFTTIFASQLTAERMIVELSKIAAFEQAKKIKNKEAYTPRQDLVAILYRNLKK